MTDARCPIVLTEPEVRSSTSLLLCTLNQSCWNIGQNIFVVDCSDAALVGCRLKMKGASMPTAFERFLVAVGSVDLALVLRKAVTVDAALSV